MKTFHLLNYKTLRLFLPFLGYFNDVPHKTTNEMRTLKLGDLIIFIKMLSVNHDSLFSL